MLRGHDGFARRREDSRFGTQSLAVAKAAAFWQVSYREAYDLHACSGICSITSTLAAGALRHAEGCRCGGAHRRRQPRASPAGRPGRRARLGLGAEYVDAMWRMVQQDEPSDYVICTRRDSAAVGLSSTRSSRIRCCRRRTTLRKTRRVVSSERYSQQRRFGGPGRASSWVGPRSFTCATSRAPMVSAARGAAPR